MGAYNEYTLTTKFLLHLGRWLSGWCDILSGLSSVLTLAQYRIGLDMGFRFWWVKHVEVPRMRIERARRERS